MWHSCYKYCGGIISSNYVLIYNVGGPHVHKTNSILRKPLLIKTLHCICALG